MFLLAPLPASAVTYHASSQFAALTDVSLGTPADSSGSDGRAGTESNGAVCELNWSDEMGWIDDDDLTLEGAGREDDAPTRCDGGGISKAHSGDALGLHTERILTRRMPHGP